MRGELSDGAYPDLQQATSSAKILRDQLIKQATSTRRKTVQNVWAVSQGPVSKRQKLTVSEVGRVGEERFGGPRTQTIRNDKGGLLAMIKLLQEAQLKNQSSHQQKPPSSKAKGELEQLLSSVGEPRLRAMIRNVFDENSARKMEERLLRCFYSKIVAGQFAMNPTDSEHKPARSTDLSEAIPTQDEREALMTFLKDEVLFDLGLKLEAGEVRTSNGRTIFPRDSVSVLKRLSGLSEDV